MSITKDKLDEWRKLAEAATERPTPYEGYTVDSEGNVWSNSNWRGFGKRKLALFPNSHGYPSVKVKHEGRMKKALVHVMVCTAFHGKKPTPDHEVRHIDGIRSNCREGNLAWGTRVENAADRKLHGTERAADNGRASAHKLVGRISEYCARGHFKDGKRSCEECHRIARRSARMQPTCITEDRVNG